MGETHHFKLGGKVWPVKFTRLRGNAVGWTFLADTKNPDVQEKILIDERAYLKGRSGLELLIHELLHALNPSFSEEAVTEQAADIARVLWVLKWRRKEGE
jgi:hypothetical protein